MERVLVEEGIRISIPVRAKLEYLSLFSGKQIKIVNSDRVVLPEQILIVVNPYLRMENCIADGRVCFFEANKFSMPHLNEQCVNKVISLYKKNAHLIKKKTRISERAAFRKALALKLQHAVEYKIKDIRESMGFKQTELRLCQENIISASKALEKMKKMLEQTKAIKKTIGKDGERVKRVIEEMMALKKNNTFKKITFKLNEIVAETPVVYCQHADKTYMLGRYEIHVSLDSNEVKIYNLTRKADGFHHPHVNQSGIPCLGTLSDVIPKYMGRAEFAVILSVLNTYLHNYNEASPYKRIKHWPEKKKGNK